MAKQKVKAQATPAAQSQEEAESLLQRIGDLQREIARIESDMNDRLSSIKREFEVLAQPLNTEIEQAFKSLQGWAEANRASLCPGRVKTARLATGDLSWRLTPPSVRVQAADVVIERMKRMGLTHMVRTKEEINKEAILAEPQAVEGIKGITITQREEFVAKPFSSEIERAATSSVAVEEAA